MRETRVRSLFTAVYDHLLVKDSMVKFISNEFIFVNQEPRIKEHVHDEMVARPVFFVWLVRSPGHHPTDHR